MWWGVKTLSQDDVKAAVLGALNSLDAKADRAAAYVVTQWRRGKSWYRKWSDGFIEQGGYKGQNTNTVTLNISFSNTDYYWNHLRYRTGSTSNGYNYFFNKTTSSIQTSDTEEYGYWYACGY